MIRINFSSSQKVHLKNQNRVWAQTRTRAIGRKLKDVQELPAAETKAALMMENGSGVSDDETDEA